MNSESRREYEGAEAKVFAETMLRKIRTDSTKWEILYEDPKTGDCWIMDYPNSNEHGGGSPRLRLVGAGKRKS